MRAIAFVLLAHIFIVLAKESYTDQTRANTFQVFLVFGSFIFIALAIVDVVKSYF